jgi:hypothetical protein
MNPKHSPFQKITAAGAIVLLCVIAAFATPTALTTQQLVQNNASTVTAGSLGITFTACDNTNGNSLTSTGREILIAQNTDSSAHTFTITPVADPYGGTNTNFTTYSLAATGSAGSTSAVQLKYQIGWVSGGVINLTCTSNLIKFAVLQYN